MSCMWCIEKIICLIPCQCSSQVAVLTCIFDYNLLLALCFQVNSSNSGFIRPCQHRSLASKNLFWPVTSNLSLSTMLVSWQVSVESCMMYEIQATCKKQVKASQDMENQGQGLRTVHFKHPHQFLSTSLPLHPPPGLTITITDWRTKFRAYHSVN